MNDEEFEVQQTRVQAAFNRWIDRLGLNWWEIEIYWKRRHHKDDIDSEGYSHKPFECWSDWRYLHASITAYLPAVADCDDATVERLMLHELVHVYLSELRQDDDTGAYLAHEERVATMLSNSIVRFQRALACEQPHIGDGAMLASD